jgi:hypothetical protein
MVINVDKVAGRVYKPSQGISDTSRNSFFTGPETLTQLCGDVFLGGLHARQNISGEN